jgi:hypothetical protein
VTADAEILALRKRRNRFIWLAIGSLVIAIGLSLPRRVARHAAHKQANAELLYLQAEIVAMQGRIRTVQTEIVAVQVQLRAPAK